LASLALVAIVGMACWREGPAAWTWGTSAFSTIRTPAWIATSLDLGNRALSLGRLPWHFFQNVLLYFAVLALVASLATVASWQALTRLISEGASIR
jgi:MFS superfamily sulfate permease-like transporter